MAQHDQQSTTDRHSTKYIWDPQKGSTIQLSNHIHAGKSPTASRVNQSDSNPDNQMLTTRHFVYAIGQIWGYAAHPLSSNRSLENSDVRFGSCQSKGLSNIESETDKGQEHIAAHPLIELQSKPDVSVFSVTSFNHGSQSPMGSGIKLATELSEEKKFSGVPVSTKLKYMYKLMSHRYPQGSSMGYYHCTRSQMDSDVINCTEQTHSKSCSRSYLDNMVSNRTTDTNLTMIYQNTLSSGNNRHILFTGNGTSFHKADCLVRSINAIEESAHLSTATCLSPSGHQFCCAVPARYNYTFEESFEKIDDQLNGRQIHHDDEADHCDMETKILAADYGKSQISPVKQQHAVAGAMAGICVSLCLHPVDTVKTVIQSCHLDRKSFCDIGRSIVSERGLNGLYRGIASNIASSAPVSALYTFTYETVKGVLLPLFPKEYCSVTHCAAGGCASVATSFIYTPSECIKQQMQVRSKYQNCWSALIGIIEKGGLASLYAGWGAVLCRNVPHSILKLACGGVAGSTAALFSTPFDVVKTRLQTQMPGFEHQYRGVFQTIMEIGKSEGFKGLYRGLAPRLIMYMTQGGLFFASYEFFKRTLGLGEWQ